MASEFNLFYEDSVYRKNKKNLVDVGFVLENSEFIDSDEEQSDDDWEPMKKGHVRVAWYPNGSEEVLPEKKVHLYDRSLMPGAVVRKIAEGKHTQLGYCRYTVVKADVQVIGSRKVILGVDSKNLIPMKELASGVTYKDSWIGSVNNIKSELTLRCSDGSRCVMSDVDAFQLDDLLDRRLSVFKKCNFYPGQELCGPVYSFKKVKWLNVTKRMRGTIKCPYKRIHVTVEDVKMLSASIHWICGACRGVVPLKPNIAGEDLKSIKMMNTFIPHAVKIGDRKFLIMREEYEVVSFEEWKNRISDKLHYESSNVFNEKQTNKFGNEIEESNMDNSNDFENMCVDSSDFEDIENEESGKSSFSTSVTSHSTASSIYTSLGLHKKRKNVRRRRAKRCWMKEMSTLKRGEKMVTETLATETKVDVVWQDGTVEQNILSTSLYPVGHLSAHKFSQFFPGDYVIDNRDSKPYDYGVVKQVDHISRTALITWMKTFQVEGDPHPEIVCEEEVSVYDVKCHPQFQFRPGSCVIGVGNSENINPGFGVGQVVDSHPTGKIEVSWDRGKTSLCYPQELYKIGVYDSHGFWTDDDTFSEEDSAEIESEKSVVESEDESEEKECALTKDLEKVSIKQEDKGGRSGMARLKEVFTWYPMLLTCNVMRRFLELFKLFKYYLVQASHMTKVACLRNVKMENGLSFLSQPVRLQQVCFTKNTFSVLESVPDQHIYKSSIFQPVKPSAFFKIVMKEVNLLRSSLPEGIIVKGFEDRIDLYSVLIKGPKQTPYEDGLFFFDFQFPADYPKVPPLCHYISYCSDRINPNLYESGNVCISLLGTWTGKGTEMWSPKTSNLIQVIISIQGLILVGEPYYNESGYERQKGTEQGQENSQMYNEMVVLKLVQAMTKLLRNPPEIFKQEIVEHFQTNASKFVQRLEKWIAVSECWNSDHPSSPISPYSFKERPINNIFAEDIPLPEFPLIPTSKGFCLTLKNALSDFKKLCLLYCHQFATSSLHC